MIATAKTLNRAEVAHRTQQIQRCWDCAERSRRVSEGERQTEMFARLIGLLNFDAEPWASDTMCTTDLERLTA